MTITPESALRHAIMIADVYLAVAVNKIDARFGEGYAKANPALTASFVMASSVDMAAALIASSLVPIDQQHSEPEEALSYD